MCDSVVGSEGTETNQTTCKSNFPMYHREI